MKESEVSVGRVSAVSSVAVRIDRRDIRRGQALGCTSSFFLFQTQHTFFHLLTGLEGYDVFLSDIDALSGARIPRLPGRTLLHLEHAEIP